MSKALFTPVAAAALLMCGAFAAQAATIVITSRDQPGVGFNDMTVVAPVGGNTGTTLGQQRLNVYRYVANIWEAQLTSNVTITVNAGWEALTCTATTAVLGSAGAWNIWHDFSGGAAGTWYPQALANKLAGVNLSAGVPDDGSGYGNVDIKTQFNVNLGNTGCLDGTPFYLGLDGQAGSKVNFVETLLHELGHGLGFSVLTVNTANGFRVDPTGANYVATGGLPSIWERFMFDDTANKTWLNMTNAERAASAINPLALGWNGPKAVAGAAITIAAGTPSAKLQTSAPGFSAFYDYATAAFGPAVTSPSTFGRLAVTPADAVNGAGCLPFDAATAASIAGKVAIIDRGVCTFVVKVKNAQNAGASAVVIANIAAGAPATMGGSDATITIPSIEVSVADGATLKNSVAASAKYGSRSQAGASILLLGTDPSRRPGMDLAGHPLLYTPSTLASGSSVSHWDVTASPNLLMEPNINNDLTTTLVPPLDLTFPLLQDIGW